MSYTPTIIFSYEDLVKAEKENDFGYLIYQDEIKDDDEWALKELAKVLSFNEDIYPLFKGIRLVIMQPEFTKKNEAVRDALSEFGIEYALNN